MSEQNHQRPQDLYQQLSEKHALLISRFCDGECSYISAYRAKRLIANNPAARNLLKELQSLKEECSQLLLTQPQASTNLWDRIEARIEQEEYTARFLGARRIEEPVASVREWLSMRHAVMGGLSGAAIAVALLTIASRPSQLLTFSAPAAGPVIGNQLVQPAGISAINAPRTHNSFAAARPHNPLEVDWMRANGSLKLIPDPSGSSAIIWVRRAPARTARKNTDAHIIPTPLGLAAPHSAVRGTREYPLDESRHSSAK